MAVNDADQQSPDSRSIGANLSSTDASLPDAADLTDGDSPSRDPLTRRRILAMGSAVGWTGLAGCLDAIDDLLVRASEEGITTTRATPASFYGGSGASDPDTRPGRHPAVAEELTYVPLTVSAQGAGRSLRVDLDGWFVDATVRAQNHNSSRSNRTSGVAWRDPDNDDEGDDGESESDGSHETVATVLRLERDLLREVDAALAAVGRRSTDESQQSLEALDGAITDIVAEVDRCGTDVCKTVRVHADVRHSEVESARKAVESGDWNAATAALEDVKAIVEEDVALLADDLDSDDDGLSTAADALYAYLEGDAVIGERCVLALPDARVRGSDESLAAEFTPERLLEYLTADPESSERATAGDGTVYAWGDVQPRFAAEITVPEWNRYDPWSQLVALGYNGDPNNSTIVNMPRSGVTASNPGADDETADGKEHTVPENWHVTSKGDLHRFSGREMHEWGPEWTVGEIAVTPTIIGSVQVQPEDCPSPMPALLHLRRIRHDDQCLYVCGWTIDDGALYDNSLTMLVAKDVNELVHVEYGEVDAMRRAIESGFDRERSKLGSMVYDGELGETALEFLPEKLRSGPGLSDLLDRTTEDLGDRGKEISIPLRGDATGTAEMALHCTLVALDAPVVHLAQDGCQEPPYCANQIPATNTVPSR